MNYRSWTICLAWLIALGAMPAYAKAQATLRNRLMMSLEPRVGALLPHHDHIAYFVEQHITGLMLNVGIQADGSKDWHSRYNFPVMGLGYYTSNLSNNSIFGHLHGLYGYFDAHFLPVHHRLNLGNRIAFGLSYATQHHHPHTNSRNYMLSTHLNVFFQYDLLLRYQLTQHLDIALMAGFTHASNGNLKEPNKGANLLSSSIAARYRLRPIGLSMSENIAVRSDSTRLGLLCGVLFGAKSFAPNDNVLTPCFGLNIELHHRLGPSNLWGVELALYHDRSLQKHHRLKHKTDDGFNPNSCYRITLHPTYIIQAGRLAIALQPGLYLNSGFLPNGRITNKLGLRCQLHRDLFASVSIKAHHFAMADFIEFALRYRFSLIE